MRSSSRRRGSSKHTLPWRDQAGVTRYGPRGITVRGTANNKHRRRAGPIWEDGMKRALLAMVACLALAGASAQAQDKYPTKPVKILVPYAPGGATDIVARIIGEQLRIILGQSFVVENKPGAFGILRVEEMSRAKPDGYTFLIGNVSTNAITPLIFTKKTSIDYLKSVTAVTRLVDIPEFILVTTKGFSAKSVPELIDNAKKTPGKVRYGTVGAGSYPHFDMAYFAKKAGDLDMIAIHNKAGASGVLNDMLSGGAQVFFP